MSNLIYLGNVRTISLDEIHRYCSKFGFVIDYSRQLTSLNVSKNLLDFVFIEFLSSKSYRKFLSISNHTLPNGITLDVRPFDEILHPAVPLQVDRKICVENFPQSFSLNELKKYFRTFGNLKETIVDDDQRNVFIEFESAASRNKLLKGKIRVHRLRDFPLKISAFLRPTDVDLTSIKPSNELDSTFSNQNEVFQKIESILQNFFDEQRENYEKLRNSLLC